MMDFLPYESEKHMETIEFTGVAPKQNFKVVLHSSLSIRLRS